MRIFYYGLSRIKSKIRLKKAKNEILGSKAGTTERKEVQGKIFRVIKSSSTLCSTMMCFVLQSQAED